MTATWNVAINTIGGTAVLLENQRQSGNWLQIAVTDLTARATRHRHPARRLSTYP